MLSKTFQHGTIYFSEIKLHLWLQTAASLPRNTHTPWRNICWIQSDKFFVFFFFFFFGGGFKLLFFSSAWLFQQSSWNRNLSVIYRRSSSAVRRSVCVAIISEPNAFQILVVASPEPYARTFFWIFEKKLSNCFWIFFPMVPTKPSLFFFSFSLTLDPMGATISKSYFSYKS